MVKSVEEVFESQDVALGLTSEDQAVDSIDPDDPISTALAVTPYYVDDSKKTRYLSYRASGFTVGESIRLAQVHERTVKRWRNDDQEFARLDTQDVGELRRTHGAAFQAAEFQRNLRMVLELDKRILGRANAVMAGGGDLGDMPKNDMDYLKTIRPMYSASNLAAMVKAVNGEKGGLDGLEIKFDEIVMGTAKAKRLQVNAKAPA